MIETQKTEKEIKWAEYLAAKKKIETLYQEKRDRILKIEDIKLYMNPVSGHVQTWREWACDAGHEGWSMKDADLIEVEWDAMEENWTEVV